MEVANPVTFYAPTERGERIFIIDVLRGIALLGILFSNIDEFAGPVVLPEIPWGPPNTIFFNSHRHLNLAILLCKWIFIEGKMRMLFSVLFGAGLVIMSERAERRGHAFLFGDVYLRRNMRLVLFGFLHGLLVFTGDILLPYGLSALLVLYRKLGPKTLLIVGGTLLLFVSSLMLPSVLGTAGDVSLNKQASVITAKREQGTDLTPAERHIEEQWQNRVASQAITRQAIETSIASSNISYFEPLLS
jgi:uncharacterized protein